MLFLEVNYLAVLVAGIVNMAVGFVWYSPALFAKPWMKLIGKTEAELKKGATPQLYLLTFVAALIEAYILAHFVIFAGAGNVMQGLQVGLLAGIGFVATAFASEYLFSRKPSKLYGITVGYHLVTLAINGALLAVWG